MSTNSSSTSSSSIGSKRGTFNYEAAKQSLASDKNLTDLERKVYARRLEKLQQHFSDSDHGVTVHRGDDGSVKWQWNDVGDDASKFTGVADSERKNPFGGKGAFGLTGSGYDRVLDYMVLNNHVNYIDIPEAITPVESKGVVAPTTKAPGLTTGHVQPTQPSVKDTPSTSNSTLPNPIKGTTTPPANNPAPPTQSNNKTTATTTTPVTYKATPAGKPVNTYIPSAMGEPTQFTQGTIRVGDIRQLSPYFDKFDKFYRGPDGYVGIDAKGQQFSFNNGEWRRSAGMLTSKYQDVSNVKKYNWNGTQISAKTVDTPTGPRTFPTPERVMVDPNGRYLMSYDGKEGSTHYWDITDPDPKKHKHVYVDPATLKGLVPYSKPSVKPNPGQKFVDANGRILVNYPYGMNKRSSFYDITDPKRKVLVTRDPASLKPYTAPSKEKGGSITYFFNKTRRFQVGGSLSYITPKSGLLNTAKSADAPLTTNLNTASKNGGFLHFLGNASEATKNINYGDLIKIIASKPVKYSAPEAPTLQYNNTPITVVKGMSYADEARIKKTAAETRPAFTRTVNPEYAAALAYSLGKQNDSVIKTIADTNAQQIAATSAQNMADIKTNISLDNEIGAHNQEIRYKNTVAKAEADYTNRAAKQQWLGDAAMTIANRSAMNHEVGVRGQIEDRQYQHTLDSETKRRELLEANNAEFTLRQQVQTQGINASPELKHQWQAAKDKVLQLQQEQKELGLSFYTDMRDIRRAGTDFGNVGSTISKAAYNIATRKDGGRIIIPKLAKGGNTDSTATVKAAIIREQGRIQAAIINAQSMERRIADSNDTEGKKLAISREKMQKEADRYFFNMLRNIMK